MNLRNLLNPFPKERTKVYGVISEKEKLDKNSYAIKIDLINQNMIEFDNQFIYSNNLIQNDNPKENLYLYFMEAYVNYQEFSRLFSDQKDDEMYEYELIPMDKYDEKCDSNTILCNIYFTASPISENSYYIKMIKKIFHIPTTMPPFRNAPLQNATNIKKELDTVFTYPIEVDCFRVHKVGQGSCNSILLKSKNKFFYDIGISKYKNADPSYDKYEKAFSKFNFKKFGTVIISHWDQDHYLGICMDTNGDILRKSWIVPEFGISPNLRRITYIIENYGRLIRIADSIIGKLYNKDEMILFKGSGNDKNDSGIILCIDNPNGKLVAMGDTSYVHANCVRSYTASGSRSKVFKNIDYLVVPHHGADVAGNIIFDPQVPVHKSGYLLYPSDAIISVGWNPDPTYRHPRDNTITKLYKKKFRIIRTDKDGRQVVKF